MKVSVVNYGMGNIFSLSNALKKVGGEFHIVNSEKDVLNADKLLLPGVGNFCKAMKILKELGLDSTIKIAAAQNKPILGICLGQQLLMDTSEEGSITKGLGLIPGEVRYFYQDPNFNAEKVPNIGWMNVQHPVLSKGKFKDRLLSGLEYGFESYFVHSLFVRTRHKEDTLAVSQYGDMQFSSVVKKGSVMGCQFHPEKSGEAGLRILKNFIDL